MAAGELNNANIQVNGNKLVIEIDMTAPRKLSESGKSKILAGSGGFYAIPGTDLKVNLNVIGPK